MGSSKVKRYALAALVVGSLGIGGLLLGKQRGMQLGPWGGERAPAGVSPGSPAGAAPHKENEGSAPSSSSSGQEKSAGTEGRGAVPTGGRGPAGAARIAGEVQPALLTGGIEAQAEANAKSVVEAARTGKFPERLNPLLMPRPFDKAAFERDPQTYLDVIEPGRVFQTADGAPGVKTLEAVGAPYLEVAPEGSVRLAVMGEPLAPVTFTSFDMGAFENKLASMTVRADSAGAASVRFTATRGTIDSVHVLAGSPMTVGQVQFLVQVERE